ncbi:histidine phosphatase family protein [Pseudomonas graminis]|uniref:histidine phosphatase family protein n=1 Tax=Pseudomonas graminis TaxID=158627 RepID=UPI0023496C40|nr:histidine phosphatase family protein [Pseudomonas graminis]MDC6378906.1 histidine phosphatase family protein [Pseudomonas graminis]
MKTPVPNPGLGAFNGDGKVQSILFFAETDFMHLYIVRHGETWANAEHRYLGSLDPELTALGRLQAHRLCEQLPASPDVLVVSPRLRAVQTASVLNERLKLSPEIMDCFRERDVGVFEGLTQGEAKKRYPQLWSQNITRLWDAGPTGGETISDVVKRVRDGLAELESKYPSKTVLLVAHGFVTKVVRALAKGDFSDFYEWQLSNGNMLILPSFKTPTQDLETLRRSLPIA